VRDLCNVIDRMVALIPREETDLLAALASRRMSALFSPPECQAERWAEVGHVLAGKFGKPPSQLDGWRRDVAEIFTGKAAS
jgi:hypothetical protein